ncbi:cation:proton antiporter subunit C [Demequina activiva]|uniref:Cation:proton antiporter n=1 Tax=Demequina activiva TaxID=1582364 RepID=A0A919Q367_9MICO|nr:cation:proton antiporter subunit C [Demequina activiva]GIG54991.1 cation:proton antiporter [Demequina activiva]
MSIAIAAGVLVAGAVYLFSRREMLRVILGFVLLSHAVNLIIIAAGGTDRRDEPIGGDLDPSLVADPLPQAFVLTAIVIAFAITIVMLVLAVTGRHDDDMSQPPQRDSEPGTQASQPTREQGGTS